MILERIQDPSDLKKLDTAQTRQLCDELRDFLLRSVSRTGGHLASNLGAVELTVAIHQVFDLSCDRLVFDVGHQCYVHKILTGRAGGFGSLRQWEGLSGFPKPAESEQDAFVAGHASNSVSVALGMARARTLQSKDYQVLALIGDGALTGGLAYEGLNDAGASGEPLIVILNDNEMSIGQNVGAVSKHLAQMRTQSAYYRFKKAYRHLLNKNELGRTIYRFNHKLKTNLKRNLFPSSTLFEEMGFSYLGPVDGHDVEQIKTALCWAKEQSWPVVLHVKTQKGRGYAPAEQKPNLYHGVSAFDLKQGVVSREKPGEFSAAFGKAMCRLAQADSRICATTAAMGDGTGLTEFAQRYPKRFFDVGIAEGHAAAMNAGMAKQGMLPVFAVYSSFLQRSYDMLIHDMSIGNIHAVLAVDRAGLVGADGETHQGVFDVPFLTHIPRMTVFAPSNCQELEQMLEEALYRTEGPVALRYPRGCEGNYRAAWDGEAVSCLEEGSDVTLISYGVLINDLLAAVQKLKEQGISAEVLKLNRLSSFDGEVICQSLQKTGRLLVLEDCVETGCVGQQLLAAAAKQGIALKKAVLCNTGSDFVPHGSVEQLKCAWGLDADSLVRKVLEEMQ